jgi:hypothetical protein
MSAHFPFQENIDVFAGEKTDKEYWLKISSKDATETSPFDFNVKFYMNTRQIEKDSSGNIISNGYKKEAVIDSKYNEIKRLEVTDVIIPRYIPNDIIGINFDGVSLVNANVDTSSNSKFLISCYPGVCMKTGENYVKLTNYKDCIVITDISNSPVFLDDDTTFRYKDLKIIDHINIDDIVYPITNVTQNLITILNFNKASSLPDSCKLVLANYFSNIIHQTDAANVSYTNTSLTINNLPIELFENTFASNILRFWDGIGRSFYMIINKYIQVGSNVKITGTFLKTNNTISGNVIFQLFGFGMKDLIDERIFYLELDPFVPVKASATDNQLDKMFGVLFPSTQSKEWLYLSGEPKECFLPRDLRKLDKITIRIFDSNGIALNDTYKNKPGLLNENYFRNLYTTVVIKVDEVDKSLVAKKS